MTRKFIVTYPRYAKKISHIVKSLRRLGFVPNIENILSFVRGQANPKEALVNSSPFVADFLYGRASHRLGYNPGAKAIVKDIQEFIAQKCLITEYHRIEMINSHYSRFFAYLERHFRIENQFEDGSAGVDIFTTNYDNVIEQFAFARGINVFTGYERTADGTCRFAPQLYYSQGPLRFYKLHGSVTLGIIENKPTKERRVVESGIGLKVGDAYGRDWKVVDRVMIHGYEKDPSQEPYFDLLYLLKEKMKKVGNVIVIGYSFSDRPILNVFKDVLNSRGDEVKITLLDKKAFKIKRSLFASDKRIRAVQSSFRDFRKIWGTHFA